VTFLGQVGDDERARLLASATVYVAPQTGGESFGIVLVEAMSAGAAVVASDIGPFRALLGGGRLGDLFAVGNPAALAHAVNGLLAAPLRRTTMAQRGTAAARRYDWDVVSGEIEAVYAAVVEAPRVASR
jgi:phosphatidylinositol alpha-mannosyltransferase